MASITVLYQKPHNDKSRKKMDKLFGKRPISNESHNQGKKRVYKYG